MFSSASGRLSGSPKGIAGTAETNRRIQASCDDNPQAYEERKPKINASLPMTTRENNRGRKKITPRIEASSRTVEERKASAKHRGEDSKRQTRTGLSQGSKKARATENHIFTIDGLQAPFQTLVDRPGPGRDRTGRRRVCQAHWVVTRPSEADTGKGLRRSSVPSWRNGGGKSFLVSGR